MRVPEFESIGNSGTRTDYNRLLVTMAAFGTNYRASDVVGRYGAEGELRCSCAALHHDRSAGLGLHSRPRHRRSRRIVGFHGKRRFLTSFSRDH